jgi:two-component system, LuxR family, sensor kinase FixL
VSAPVDQVATVQNKGFSAAVRYAFSQALVAAAFLALAMLGMQFMLPEANVALVWPASGLALAAVYRLGNGALVGIALGAFAAFLLKMQAPVPALAMAGGAVAGAALGATILRLCAVDRKLAKPADLVALLAAVATASSAASFVGAATMFLGGFTQWQGFQPLWWICWVADAGGALLLAPALLAWEPERTGRRRQLEWLLLGLSVALLAGSVYAEMVAAAPMGRALSYLVFPLLIVAAMRLGVREVSLLLLLHGAIALYYTAQMSGPFATGGLRDSVLALHAQLAMLGASMLLLASAMSQQRRASAALREQEALYRLLVENQTDLVLKFDLAGRLLFASPSVTQVLGAVGLPGQLAQELSASLGETLRANGCAAKTVLELEQLTPTPQGQRWISWRAKSVQEQGEPCAIVAVGRDVTERHEAEQKARRHLEELARAGRIGAMGELAAGLAHELNQPLCAINNYSSAGLRLLRAEHDPDLREAMERIAANATRAGGIIGQMRAFVRQDGPIMQRTDINVLVREVITLIANDARQHDVSIELDLADDLPPVEAVPIQIQQVLLNLIRNGMQAILTAQSEPRLVEVLTRRNASQVEVVVRDSGPGLPEDQLERVFEPFVTTKSGGIGLGLSISRSILEAHGGRLEASRPPTGGTEFRFALPQEQPFAR